MSDKKKIAAFGIKIQNESRIAYPILNGANVILATIWNSILAQWTVSMHLDGPIGSISKTINQDRARRSFPDATPDAGVHQR